MSARPLAWFAGIAILVMLAAIWANVQVLEAVEGQFNRTAAFVLPVTGQEPMGAAITLERVAEASGLIGLILIAVVLLSRIGRLRLRPKA